MKINLSNRVFVVTGGSEGIGKGIAMTLATCGAKVGIISRDEADLQAVVGSIKSAGGNAIYTAADVTDDAALKKAIDSIADHYGGIHGIVANAGINGTWAPVDELSPDDWRRTIDINLTGTFLSIHHSVPHLRQQGSGSIVIVSSINGTRTFTSAGATAYASSKAGQLAFGQMLAIELAPSKIRVNIICPGGIESNIHEKTQREDTDQIGVKVEYPDGSIPLTEGDMGKPEDVASMTAFLLSDLAKHITGTPIWIDGGQSLLQ